MLYTKYTLGRVIEEYAVQHLKMKKKREGKSTQFFHSAARSLSVLFNEKRLDYLETS